MGMADIGQPATFGCAMLDDEDAAALFHLAVPLGMPLCSEKKLRTG